MALQQGRDQRPGDDEEGIQNIHRGDGAGAPVGRRNCLHRGKERDHEQSSRGGEAHDIKADEQASWASQKIDQRHIGLLRPGAANAVRRQSKRDEKDGHAEGCERHRFQLDAAAGNPRRGERAHADADGK